MIFAWRPRSLSKLEGVKPITMATAYNSLVARSLEEAGVLVILVGAVLTFNQVMSVMTLSL